MEKMPRKSECPCNVMDSLSVLTSVTEDMLPERPCYAANTCEMFVRAFLRHYLNLCQRFVLYQISVNDLSEYCDKYLRVKIIRVHHILRHINKIFCKTYIDIWQMLFKYSSENKYLKICLLSVKYWPERYSWYIRKSGGNDLYVRNNLSF